jgi:2-polyprenyl-3-methyl-5-hydroxy-6-metoxy-1,4-benzoquinol methylase
VYKYDGDFYNYINEGAQSSARALLPVLLAALPAPIESVMDVGCGAGAWLDVWKSYGSRITGLDGSYVPAEQLLINSEEFIATDLTEHFQLGRTFDLVQSLEVAEHLPETVAENLWHACACTPPWCCFLLPL